MLGSRWLEGQKKVGETAQAIVLRQSGENSILGNIAVNDWLGLPLSVAEILSRHAMHWIAPSEKDSKAVALDTRSSDAALQIRASSGLRVAAQARWQFQ